MQPWQGSSSNRRAGSSDCSLPAPRKQPVRSPRALALSAGSTARQARARHSRNFVCIVWVLSGCVLGSSRRDQRADKGLEESLKGERAQTGAPMRWQSPLRAPSCKALKPVVRPQGTGLVLRALKIIDSSNKYHGPAQRAAGQRAGSRNAGRTENCPLTGRQTRTKPCRTVQCCSGNPACMLLAPLVVVVVVEGPKLAPLSWAGLGHLPCADRLQRTVRQGATLVAGALTC